LNNPQNIPGKTRGIILHIFPYNDTCNILHIYTEDFGKASFIATKHRSRKNKKPGNIFVPLTIHSIEIQTAKHNHGSSMMRIRETKPEAPLQNISSNPLKVTIALFLSEIILRTIREGEPDPRLFNFLRHTVYTLETSATGIANFHIAFLIRLLDHLGLSPRISSYTEGSRFDMLEGLFTSGRISHPYELSPDHSRILRDLLRIDYRNMSRFSFSRNDRVLILNKTIEYYRLHLPHISDIKSLAVLQAIFN
jgi:DNA repair protein RecO (recombination protein O)